MKSYTTYHIWERYPVYLRKHYWKEHAGYPKFESKHDNRKSYTTSYTNRNISVDFEFGKIKLPKLKQIKAKLYRKFKGQIKPVTVSQVPSSKYFVLLLVETERSSLPIMKGKVGLDLGVKDLCITSAGRKYNNPQTLAGQERKLAKLQGEDLKEKRDILQKDIQDKFPSEMKKHDIEMKKSDIEIFDQGSYKYSTTIYPIKNQI